MVSEGGPAVGVVVEDRAGAVEVDPGRLLGADNGIGFRYRPADPPSVLPQPLFDHADGLRHRNRARHHLAALDVGRDDRRNQVGALRQPLEAGFDPGLLAGGQPFPLWGDQGQGLSDGGDLQIALTAGQQAGQLVALHLPDQVAAVAYEVNRV